MKTTGIIAEYNPFHNGHAKHIALTRQATGCSHIVAVMSGHFVQRGEAAIFDKWSRAEMAVRGGVDLVVELPFLFAVRSAQHFAAGGVRLLAGLQVSQICFGAEGGDLASLTKGALVFSNPAAAEKLRCYLDQGKSYAQAAALAISYAASLDEEYISSPNNILGMEYLRAIRRYAPSLLPVAVAREGASYHDPVIRGAIASATAVRQAICQSGEIDTIVGQALPQTSREIIERLIQEKKGPVSTASLDVPLLAGLRRSCLEALANIPDVTEGIHHKILAGSLQANSAEQLYSMVKSRRYTRTRLQRIAMHALVGTTKEMAAYADSSGPLYARVLAFNSGGRQLLRHLSDKCPVPLIIRAADYVNSRQRSGAVLTPLQQMLAIDTLSSDLYALAMPDPAWRSGAWDFLRSPVYVT